MALQPTVRRISGRSSQAAGGDAASLRQHASPGLVLLIVCAGVVLASLDLFIVNVALPQMGRDFHLRGGGLGDLSWVLNGYAIVYAALLVLFGRIAERVVRERTAGDEINPDVAVQTHDLGKRRSFLHEALIRLGTPAGS